MSTESGIDERIESAAEAVGSVWPLHSFVTSNPLAGFEDRPFHEAVADAERLLGGDGYPSAGVFRRAWEAGQIDDDVLATHLTDHGFDADPETALDRMAEQDSAGSADEEATATDRVDAVVTKWLAAFLDQGTAEWPMPNRDEGFYDAFRTVAPHDGDIPDGEAITSLPEHPADAIRECLDEYPDEQWTDVFEFHFAALPGWTGYLKQRAEDGDVWQSTYPISLSGYLAVRLALADVFDAPVSPPETAGEPTAADRDDEVPLPEVWLSAWEATYRAELVDSLTDASASVAEDVESDRPDAQPTTRR